MHTQLPTHTHTHTDMHTLTQMFSFNWAISETWANICMDYWPLCLSAAPYWRTKTLLPAYWMRKKVFVFDKHIVTHSQAGFTKTHKHLFNMQQKRTFSSWNTPRHGSENQGFSRASQKFEAGSASFILKAAVIIACFFSLFPSRESKQILLWKCYWLWMEATVVLFLFPDLDV